jgi:maleate isomerase
MTGDPFIVGVVTPHAAAGPEVELPAMTRGRVATVVSRTGSPPEASQAPSRPDPPAHAELRASTEPAALDRAAAIFRGSTLAAVAHASTTSGYVIGHREEADLGRQRFWNCARAGAVAGVRSRRSRPRCRTPGG